MPNKEEYDICKKKILAEMSNEEIYLEFKNRLKIEANNIAHEFNQINLCPDIKAKASLGRKSEKTGNDRTLYNWVYVTSGKKKVGFINLFLNEIDSQTVNPHTQFGKITFGIGANGNKHCLVKFQNCKQLNPTVDKDTRRLKKGIVKFDFDKYDDSKISIFDDDYSAKEVADEFKKWLEKSKSLNKGDESLW